MRLSVRRVASGARVPSRMAQPLFNLDLEKKFLSGTILHPETRAETSKLVASELSKVNGTVLNAIDACVAGGERFSVHLLIDKLNSLGLKLAETIEPGIYVKSLEGLAVGEKAVLGIAKQLKTVATRRRLHETAQRLADAMTDQKAAEMKATELVAKATEIFNSQVNLLSGGGDDEPKDLFGTVGDFINAETVYDTRSITLPYAMMHDMYGALDLGVTTIVSRMKVGKSTFWLSTLQQLAAADVDDSFRALVLDTELTREENQSRAISAVSGVKEYLIRHKIYRKYPEMLKKVRAAEALLAPLAGRVSHIYVGGMALDQMIIIARRWAARTLKPGKKGLIVLDYFKMQNADFADKSASLFLSLGAKIEAFKNLTKEINVPVLAFCQANRSGEDSKDGHRLQNSSIIGGSDLIAQFSSNVYLLDRLSPEERMQLCPDQSQKFTHRILPLATRVLGPDNHQRARLVRYKDGRGKDRWTDNYLLFNFDSFNVREAQNPTLWDLLQRQGLSQVPVQSTENLPEDAPTLDAA